MLALVFFGYNASGLFSLVSSLHSPLRSKVDWLHKPRLSFWLASGLAFLSASSLLLSLLLSLSLSSSPCFTTSCSPSPFPFPHPCHRLAVLYGTGVQVLCMCSSSIVLVRAQLQRRFFKTFPRFSPSYSPCLIYTSFSLFKLRPCLVCSHRRAVVL